MKAGQVSNFVHALEQSACCKTCLEAHAQHLRMQCCTLFDHLRGQSVLETKFNRIRCPDDAKTVGHQTGRKQNPWL